MFEGAIAALLQKYLGAFVQLDQRDIHIGSDVTLSNVALSRDALVRFGLPLQIKRGFVGRLHIQLPWLHLLSRAVVITLEDVYAVVGLEGNVEPPTEEELQRKKMKRVQQAEKKLAEVEAKRAEQRAGASGAKKAAKPAGDGFGKRLGMKIVDNLQVVINNLHLRYETEGRAFGVTIESITAETTNDQWQSAYVNVDLEHNAQLYKIARVRSLSVYGDQLFGNAVSSLPDREFIRAMHDMLPRDGHRPPHQFILSPLSAIVRLTIDKSPNRGAASGTPRPFLQLSVDIDGVDISLSNVQLASIMKTVDFFMSTQLRQRYFRARPKISPLMNPAAWWRFAIASVQRDLRERPGRATLSGVLAHVQRMRKYVELHSRRLLQRQLAPDQQAALDALECTLSFDDIMLFRALARRVSLSQVAAVPSPAAGQAAPLPPPPPPKPGFFSRVFGFVRGRGNTAAATAAAAAAAAAASSDSMRSLSQAVLSDAEREMLFTSIGARPGDDTPLVDDEGDPAREKISIAVTINSGSFRISRGMTDVLSVNYSQFLFKFVKRVRGSLLAISLQDLRAVDLCTPGSVFPQMLQPSMANGTEPLLSLRLDRQPVSGPAAAEKAVMGIELRMAPVTVVGSGFCIAQIVRFASDARPKGLHALQAKMIARVEALRRAARLTLTEALASRKKLFADLKISGPTVIVPQRVNDVHSPSVQLRMADIAFTSRSTVGEVERPFDTYLLELAGLHISLSDPDGAALQHAASPAPGTLSDERAVEQRYALLDDMRLDVELRKAIAPSLDLPEMDVRVSLPRIQILGELEHVRVVLSILNHVMRSFREPDVPLPAEVARDLAFSNLDKASALDSIRRRRKQRGRRQNAAASARGADYDSDDEEAMTNEAAQAVWQVLDEQSHRLITESMLRTVQLRLGVFIGELGVDVTMRSEPILSLRASKVTLAMSQRELDRELNLRLSSLVIRHPATGRYEYLLSHESLSRTSLNKATPSEAADPLLLDVLLVTCNPRHPEFRKAFNALALRLQATIAPIKVTVNPPVVERVLSYVSGVVGAMRSSSDKAPAALEAADTSEAMTDDDADDETDDPTVIAQATSAPGPAGPAAAAGSAARLPASPAVSTAAAPPSGTTPAEAPRPRVLMDLRVKLDQFEVLLLDRDAQPVGTVVISSVMAGMQRGPQYLGVVANMRDLQVRSLGAFESTVVSNRSGSDQLLRVELNKFSGPLARRVNFDMSVSLFADTLLVVVNMDFIAAVRRALVIKKPEFDGPAAPAPRPAPRETHQPVNKPRLRIHFDVDVRAPLICLPLPTIEGLLLDMGRIRALSRISPLVDRLDVKLTDLGAQVFRPSTAQASNVAPSMRDVRWLENLLGNPDFDTSRLIEPVDLRACIRRPIGGSASAPTTAAVTPAKAAAGAARTPTSALIARDLNTSVRAVAGDSPEASGAAAVGEQALSQTEISLMLVAFNVSVRRWHVDFAKRMLTYITTSLRQGSPPSAAPRRPRRGSVVEGTPPRGDERAAAPHKPKSSGGTPLLVSARIQQLLLALVEDDAAGLTSIRITDLHADMHRMALGDMALRAELSSLCLSDERQDRGAFRELLVLRPPEPSTPATPAATPTAAHDAPSSGIADALRRKAEAGESSAIVFEMESSPTSDTQLRVRLESPRVVPVLSCVFLTKDFFKPFMGASAPPPAQPQPAQPSGTRTRSSSHASASSATGRERAGSSTVRSLASALVASPVLASPGAAAAAAKSAPRVRTKSTSISIKLRSPQVVVPNDFNDRRASRASLLFDLTASLSLGPAATEISAQLSSLQVVAHLARADRPEPITQVVIRPFDVAAMFTLEKPNTMRVALRMDPMFVVFSYTNYRLTMQILRAIKADTRSSSTAPPPPSSSSSTTTTASAPTSARSSGTATDDHASALAAAGVSEPSVGAGTGLPAAGTSSAALLDVHATPLESAPEELEVVIDEAPDSALAVAADSAPASSAAPVSAPLPTAAVAEAPAAPPRVIFASVDWKGMYLIISDDSKGYNRPVLGVEVTGLQGRLKGIVGGLMKAKLTLGLGLDYFNDSLVAWEPLIEPWSCRAQLQLNPRTCSVIAITAEKKLDVTVTASCVAALLTIIRSWREDLKRDQPMQATFQPYRIVNHSGLPIHLEVPHFGTTIDLADGHEEAFGLAHLDRSSMRTRSAAHANIAFENYMPLNDVPIDFVGLRSYFLLAREKGQLPVTCVVAVDVKEGVKTITVGSRIRIENEARVLLEVRCSTPDAPDVVRSWTIDQHEAVWIPMPMSHGTVQVRRHRDDETHRIDDAVLSRATRQERRRRRRLSRAATLARGQSLLESVLAAEAEAELGEARQLERDRLAAGEPAADDDEPPAPADAQVAAMLRAAARVRFADRGGGGGGGGDGEGAGGGDDDDDDGDDDDDDDASDGEGGDAEAGWGSLLPLDSLSAVSSLYGDASTDLFLELTIEQIAQASALGGDGSTTTAGARARAMLGELPTRSAASTESASASRNVVKLRPFAAARCVLRAPLALENRLPFPLDFEFIDEKADTHIFGRLARSEIAELCQLDTRHRLSLRVRLPGLIDDWSRPSNVEFDKIILATRSAGSLMLNLDARMESTTLIYTLNAPFWLVNRVRRPLVFAPANEEMAPLQEHPADNMDRILLFSYTRNELLRSMTKVWLPGSAPKKIAMNSVNIIGAFELLDEQRGCVVPIGHQTKLASAPYGPTKIVTFVPRFMIINRAGVAFEVCQDGAHIANSSVAPAPGPADSGDVHVDVPGADAGASASTSPRSQHVFRIEPDGEHVLEWTLPKGTRRIRVRTGDTVWSRAIPVDDARDASMFLRDDAERPRVLFRVEIRVDSPTVFIILLNESQDSPTYRIENNTDLELFVGQKSSSLVSVLPPRSALPFGWDDPVSDRLVNVALGERNGRIAQVYNIDRLVRYRRLRDENSDLRFRAAVVADGPTRVLVVQQYRKHHTTARPSRLPLARASKLLHTGGGGGDDGDDDDDDDVDNGNDDAVDGDAGARAQLRRVALPQVLVVSSATDADALDAPSAVDEPSSAAPAAAAAAAAAATTTTTNTGDQVDLRTEKEDVVVDAGVAAQLKAADEEEEEVLDAKSVLRFCVSLAGIGVSLVDATPRELLYLSIENIVAKWYRTTQQDQYSFDAGVLQIDAMTRDARFDILLGVVPLRQPGVPAPAQPARRPVDAMAAVAEPMPVRGAPVVNEPVDDDDNDNDDGVESTAAASKASDTAHQQLTCLQMALVKTRKSEDVDMFPYISILLQEMQLNADDEIIMSVVTAVSSLPLRSKDPRDRDPMPPAPVVPKTGKRRVYIAFLQLHPVVIRITFALSASSQRPTSSSHPLAVIGKALGVMFANVDGVRIRFRSLMLQHPFLTRDALMARIKRFYIQQAIREAYKIFASINVLGDPAGLFEDMKAGVTELYYAPREGFVAGPGSFGKGVLRGIRSLVSHTIHGIFNATSKITGSIGAGLARLTMDDDYVRDRERQRRQQPRHVLEGLWQGAKALGRGIFEGLIGIFKQPIIGARREGVRGFFKGLGRGLIGIFVKPVTGLLDFGTKTMEGIKNTTRLNEPRIYRRRSPRIFGPNGELIPYDAARSEGYEILFRCEHGLYRHETYVHHLDFSRRILILTLDHVLYVKDREQLFARDWAVPYKFIQTVRLYSEQVVISVKDEYVHLFQIGHDRVIECGTTEAAVQVHARITTSMREWWLRRHERHMARDHRASLRSSLSLAHASMARLREVAAESADAPAARAAKDA